MRVLAVKKSRRKNMLFGKTENYKTVLFRGPQQLIGKFVTVKITGYSSWGLKGKINQR